MDETSASQTPAGTNGYAVAAAVFGTLGACFVGIPLAIVALVQTHRSGQRGRALAIVGLVTSCVWIAMIAVAGTRGGAGQATRDDLSVIDRGGTESITQLRAGDCVEQLDRRQELPAAIPVVPCTSLHAFEVYAIVSLRRGDYPGEDEVAKLAGDRCQQELEQVADANPDVVRDASLMLTIIVPREEDWRRDDRGVACLVSTGDKRTGSIMQAPA